MMQKKWLGLFQKGLIFAIGVFVFAAVLVNLSHVPVVDAWLFRLFGKPCERPIVYSIGRFDKAFGISQQSFLTAIDQAAQIWAKPIGHPLFRYDQANGDLKINLVYDYRQQATQRLQKLGITVADDRATYDALYAKYQSLTKLVDQKQASLDQAVQAYDKQSKALDAQITYWNARGGAPPKEYQQMIQQQQALKAQEQSLTRMETDVNASIDDLNAVIEVLNHQADILNLTVSRYQTVGSPLTREFEEGVYHQSATDTSITVYQFTDRAQLVRVLAHELGHALQLQHADDPKAIMYRLNRGTNAVLTTTDVAELKAACGL